MNNLVRETHSLTLALAMELLHVALKEAESERVQISIVLVGPAGEVIHLAHMDGAPFLSREVALNKALTAASFKASTSSWKTRLAACSDAVRQGLPLQPNIALFGGGEPLFYKGQLIGAVGISGASERIDECCAKAVVARLTDLTGQA
ncbi:heme-binding protein [Pseudomonas sp. Irchel s3f7]|jgi:uncharacterized protein GlcG (DUF336 family)|uniref:GlcG/HbpS family heme-binding protein n=1 Tax=Pseudomonas sp. Irchel s3f7 TaxID=2009153 RepID=UPI000BA372D0|nr:heme-binding protein [Pseudomonas sp. Irchel s3f7]